MELKEGMYVRTDNGIGKYIGYNEMEFWDGKGKATYREFLREPSYNIIDLIEVGDYVNGYKLLYQDSHYSYFDTDTCDWIYIKKDEQIKSILTKEMFESMSYKVGE